MNEYEKLIRTHNIRIVVMFQCRLLNRYCNEFLCGALRNSHQNQNDQKRFDGTFILPPWRFAQAQRCDSAIDGTLNIGY